MIIPTILREELAMAIRSALMQESVEAEVIVVADLPATAKRNQLTEGATQVIFTGGGKGAGYARNLGIANANSEFVAFLDDDDYWLPKKLVNQLTLYNAVASPYGVIGGRIVHVRGPEDVPKNPAPDVLVRGERIEDYLFLNRAPGMGRTSFHTSTIFLRTTFAKEVPWDSKIPRHQDWDWLVRLQRAGADFHQCQSADTIYRLSDQGSISASTKWRPSLDWARANRDEWQRQTYVDFLFAQPLRYALLSRSSTGVRATLSEILKAKRLPKIGPMIIGLSGVVPRRSAIRLASLLSNLKKKH
ncbi:glycosyltransferase family 2 protein [Leucobacter sp. USHLN154]|uniref:glycosyltransferase family 2 protein n=1 Tax=Leucobacter sp. USHLN154 TaxID=3081269 RepID=UPI003019FFD8